MDKNLKIMLSLTLIIIFLVSNLSLAESFAAVNSDYNVTGMSPTSPSSPSPTPTTSPSASPSSPAPTTQPSKKTEPSGTIEVSRTKYAALLVERLMKTLEVEDRKNLKIILDNLPRKNLTPAEAITLNRIMKEQKERLDVLIALKEILETLVPPTP